MVALWGGAVVLSILAVLFVLWPLWRYRANQSIGGIVNIEERLAENVRLFHEHLAELELQLANGRIDQPQFAQLKLEQERALLEDEANIRQMQQTQQLKVGVPTFATVALLVVLGAYGLYYEFGSSADVEIRMAHAEKLNLDMLDFQAGRNADPVRTRELVKLIEARLADNPEQVQYWFF